jgi:hypothetical protein
LPAGRRITKSASLSNERSSEPSSRQARHATRRPAGETVGWSSATVGPVSTDTAAGNVGGASDSGARGMTFCLTGE